MQIERNIQRYVIRSNASVRLAMETLDQTGLRILFVIDESQRLVGVFNDGDLRRWLLHNTSPNLELDVAQACNRQFISCAVDESYVRIADQLSERISHVPLVDSDGKLVAVAHLESTAIRIGQHSINAESPCFVIAEIGNNHNGSLDLAKRLVDEAIGADADCVKFQMRDLSSLYRNEGDSNDNREDLGSQYVLDLLTRFQLTPDEFSELFDHCRDSDVVPICTPFDTISVQRLEQMGIAAYKTASADLTNHELLTEIASKGKPMICSTGMSSEEEIADAIGVLNAAGAKFVLLHCNSTYPAPYRDINLRYMNRLRSLGGGFVGYSGHERGYHIPIAAVSMGAKVIEKHFTLDRTMEGNDHKVSLLPDEFSRMVACIRELEESLGDGKVRMVSQGERMNREILGKSLVVSRSVKTGEAFDAAAIEVRSPGQGLPPYYKSELIGRLAQRDIQAGDFLHQSDLDGSRLEPRAYKFQHSFGVPVRYHDLTALAGRSNFDLIEFHMSYKDLEVVPTEHVPETLDIGFVVHAPELFANDHTLDLCAKDNEYRYRSVAEMQRVVNLTRELKPHFPNTERPMIVVNVGGFTRTGFLPEASKQELYDLLADSLERIDADGVELIPQTMPPYPWHFGGQQFHNLFVAQEEIVAFCETHHMRVCFDIAHSKLACNEFDWDFKKFVNEIAPYSAHLHISDCRGANDEGLQIGEGDIDFVSLFRQLRVSAPGASWIPEIWQGHKNFGEGFWTAFERLEALEQSSL